MSTAEMRENEYDTSTLLNEINVDYARTMNKIIFDANMTVPENKHIAASLSLPESTMQKTSPPVPEKGVVPCTQYDLEDRFKSFVFGTFLVQPEVVYVLERVQAQCNSILSMRLFNTSAKRSLKMDEFLSLQSRSIKQSTRQTVDDWPSSVAMTIKNGLVSVGKGHFDVDMSKTDMYKFSKLRKLLRRINFVMEDSLRIMMRNSVEEFTKFVEYSCEGRVVHGELPRDTKTMYAAVGATLAEEQIALLSRQQPVFKIIVRKSKEKAILNSEEIKDGEDAIAQWKEDNREEIEKAEKTGKGMPKCPLEPVPPLEGFIFEYDTSPADCVNTVSRVWIFHCRSSRILIGVLCPNKCS